MVPKPDQNNTHARSNASARQPMPAIVVSARQGSARTRPVLSKGERAEVRGLVDRDMIRALDAPETRNDMAPTRQITPLTSPRPADKRGQAAERICAVHLSAMGGNLAEAVGLHHRQRLIGLSLLAMPLLFPVALPGMASAVGVFCLVVAVGLLLGRSVPLPGWLANRQLPEQAKRLLMSAVGRVIRLIARLGRPRLLPLTHARLRPLQGSMLSAAGLAMMVPVPMISFDNVLPALAMVLIAWGLRLRDGLMLLAGYLVTFLAVVSVLALWWGGAYLVSELLAGLGSFWNR